MEFPGGELGRCHGLTVVFYDDTSRDEFLLQQKVIH
jgi:hypothetical protein